MGFFKPERHLWIEGEMLGEILDFQKGERSGRRKMNRSDFVEHYGFSWNVMVTQVKRLTWKGDRWVTFDSAMFQKCSAMFSFMKSMFSFMKFKIRFRYDVSCTCKCSFRKLEGRGHEWCGMGENVWSTLMRSKVYYLVEVTERSHFEKLRGVGEASFG